MCGGAYLGFSRWFHLHPVMGWIINTVTEGVKRVESESEVCGGVTNASESIPDEPVWYVLYPVVLAFL